MKTYTPIESILHYYLGSGLELDVIHKTNQEENGVYQLDIDLLSDIIYCDTYDSAKPIFYSLEDLDKEIVVEGYNEGKPFVPKKHIMAWHDDLQEIFWEKTEPKHWPFAEVQKIISWNFNVFEHELSPDSWIRKQVQPQPPSGYK